MLKRLLLAWVIGLAIGQLTGRSVTDPGPFFVALAVLLILEGGVRLFWSYLSGMAAGAGALTVLRREERRRLYRQSREAAWGDPDGAPMVGEWGEDPSGPGPGPDPRPRIRKIP